MTPKDLNIRADLEIIAELVEENSSVLDLGCGEGDLLWKLIHEKAVQGHGVEIYDKYICSCVEKGVPVIHANLDEGLDDYPDQSFDYVILSRTLQVVRKPHLILKEMLRVGKKGIVSFPNFGYWRVRSQLFFKGKMPVTKTLPYTWYDTPNIHLLTIKDFYQFCQQEGIRILAQINLTRNKKTYFFPRISSNCFTELGIFLIENNISGSE